MPKKPQGIVAIFTDETGNPTASVSDFHTDRFGGMKLAECQEHRARNALAREIVRVYCSDLIVRALSQYHCEQLARELTGSHKCKISIVPIGYDEE